jgi:hypothetical protein
MIISADDIRTVRPIATNTDDANRINPYIHETEILYLIPALGAEKYKEISDYTTLKNAFEPSEEIPTFEETASIETILDGGYYTDSCTNELAHFEGLTKALAHLAYSRMVANNQINVTPFGVVGKLSIDSEKVDEKILVRTSKESEQVGREYLQQTVKYITQIDGLNQVKNVYNKKYKVIGD